MLPKAATAVAILGVATGVAAQTQFNVNATVQNSLTVTNEADMNLGTLFAVSADADDYKWVTLQPNGNYGTVYGSSDLVLLTLGGQSAARGSVAVGNTTPVSITLPDAVFAAADLQTATNGGTNGTAFSTAQAAANAVEVRVADPAVARFFLGNFRAGSVVSGASGTNCGATNTCTITPAFGATSISFGIGATLMTDVSGTRTAYEEAAYSGSFEVEASY
ncbi:hypothetical protein C8261_04975 [Pseudothauera lacus]|uniref:Uncharacterized protein n=2 Tax=Pseudothauera lacus TaxID=2136175 RepID=A0A2T4IHX8_9RHOO|nr:hypothetical protein C8261_04975 [Pseudothauera lacus]